jgi:hypothetical protein
MEINIMLLGAIAMACFTISLFFVRFWLTTRDRFFLYFSVSFAIEGCIRVMLVLLELPTEKEPLIYLMRLLAFILILYAIIDKNWLGNGNRKKPEA